MAGQRYSKQREIILEYVRSTKEHPTAEMVYDALHDEHPHLSLATVYRNLKLLASDGTITCIPLSVERYDGTTDEHAHFWCNECRQLLDIEADFTTPVKRVARQCPHDIERYEVLFFGTCANCAEKQQEELA